MRVLVVDDDQAVRDFFSRFLGLCGSQAVCAESGERAAQLFREGHFDLSFVDMRMPGLNGLETFRCLREINPAAAVVIMTGYSEDNLLQEAKREGVYSVVSKPFEVGWLKEIIKDVARQKKEVGK